MTSEETKAEKAKPAPKCTPIGGPGPPNSCLLIPFCVKAEEKQPTRPARPDALLWDVDTGRRCPHPQGPAASQGEHVLQPPAGHQGAVPAALQRAERLGPAPSAQGEQQTQRPLKDPRRQR